jgi:HlyD family secretion protein
MTGTAKASKPKGKGIKLWWIVVPVLLVGGVFAATALRPNAGGAASTATKAETVVVNAGTFRDSVTGPGTVAAETTLDIKPNVAGTIQSLASVGDRVQRGQLIARIDPTNYQRTLETAQLSLQKAQAQLAGSAASQASSRASQTQTISNAQTQFENAQNTLQSAQTALTNAQQLYSIGGGTRQAVTDAQTALENAQASLNNARVALNTARNAVGLQGESNAADTRNLQLAVDTARITVKNAAQDLANTKIYAPFDSTVASVAGQVGGPASSNAALMTLLNDKQVTLPVQVDETEISKVKLGQRADVTLDAIQGRTFTGKVTSITPQATVVSNIAVFYVTVTLENADLALRPGMSAEAEIVAREIPNAVLVPRRAVETVRTRSYVTVQTPASPDGTGTPTTERVRVKTAGDDGTNVAVTDGLKGGETIVYPTRQTSTTTRTGGGILPPMGGGR